MKQEKTEKLSKIFKGNELHFLSFIYSLEMNTESIIMNVSPNQKIIANPIERKLSVCLNISNVSF